MGGKGVNIVHKAIATFIVFLNVVTLSVHSHSITTHMMIAAKHIMLITLTSRPSPKVAVIN